MSAEEHFIDVVPPYIQMYMDDFKVGLDDASAAFGNFGHESNGFTDLQEKNPIGGGKGGWGWAQWTGIRRAQFFAFCNRNSLDPASPLTNYKFMWNELSGTKGFENHSFVINKVKRAETLEDKVIAFEQGYERAHEGHKHYDRRLYWAKIAKEAYLDYSDNEVPTIPGEPAAPQEPPVFGFPDPTQHPWEAILAANGVINIAISTLMKGTKNGRN